MSIPGEHHYLPKFYLRRWAKNGVLTRFVRPRGLLGLVHGKSVAPGAVGKEQDLYALPGESEPSVRQSIELDFLQKIDDLASKALAKLEVGEPASEQDRISFAQFWLSLLHRSPARLNWLRDELGRRMVELDNLDESERESCLQRGALAIFTDVLGSTSALQVLTRQKIYRIDAPATRHSFMTSDRPTMLSYKGLLEPGGFMLLPVGPQSLAIMTSDENVVRAFAEQEANTLVKAVNDAVVKQADQLVVASSPQQMQFVENRLMRSKTSLMPHIGNDGLVRWNAP